MKKSLIALSMLLGLCFLFSPAISGIYEWTDKNGVKQFSDTPPANNVPVKEKRELHSSSVKQSDPKPEVTPAKKETTNKKTSTETVRKPPVQTNKVELFSTSWCKYCIYARNFLIKNNIQFTEYDIEKDPDAAKRKQQITGPRSGVPFAIINGKGVIGFSEATYSRMLDLP